MRALRAPWLLGLLASACGGSSGSPSDDSRLPTTHNPCATAAVDGGRSGRSSAAPDPAAARARRRTSSTAIRGGACSTPSGRTARPDARHARTRAGIRVAACRRAHAADVGDIAVVQDTGDLILPPNTYDLAASGCASPATAPAATTSRESTATSAPTLGTRLTLTTTTARAARCRSVSVLRHGRRRPRSSIPTATSRSRKPDKSSTERNVARLLTGPPRVAPFLADLDPTAGTAGSFVNAAADQYTVTWCNVRGFDSTRTVTVQATLLPDGSDRDEVRRRRSTSRDAVVGLSPGRTGDFTHREPERPARPTAAGAVGERFAPQAQLDLVALSQEVLPARIPTTTIRSCCGPTRRSITDAFAYETTVEERDPRHRRRHLRSLRPSSAAPAGCAAWW